MKLIDSYSKYASGFSPFPLVNPTIRYVREMARERRTFKAGYACLEEAAEDGPLFEIESIDQLTLTAAGNLRKHPCRNL